MIFCLVMIDVASVAKKMTLKSIPPGPAKVGVVGVNNVCIKKCNKFLEPKNESFSAFFCSFLR